MVNLNTDLPEPTRELAGKVILLEAVAGTARRNLLQQWLQDAGQNLDATTWLLDCQFSTGGAWAGLQDLVVDVASQVEQQEPDLLGKHSYELCLTAPTLRR